MPQPHSGQVHIDKPLTNLSVAHIQDAKDFVASSVFPIVGVPKRSDKYFTYDRDDWKRSLARVRAPGTESAGGGFGVSNDSYSCDVIAFHKDVDDQTRQNTDDPLSPDQDAMEFVTRQMLLKREVDFMSTFLTTSVWGRDYTGISGSSSGTDLKYWSSSSSTPIADVKAAKLYLKELTGLVANKLLLSESVFNKLSEHADIIDRIKYTQGGGAIATVQLLAALFGVDEVVVASAIQDTSKEGAAEASSFIMGKHALLVHAPKSPGLRVPSAGYTFAWTGMPGAGSFGNTISRFRMEHLKADRVEAEMAYDLKKVSADLGIFFNGIIA